MLNINDSTNTLRNSQKINLDELLEDYELDFSTFTDIDDRLLDIEDNWNKLRKPEQIILILYAEYQSYRDVAALLGCSHSSVSNYIRDIREKLLC